MDHTAKALLQGIERRLEALERRVGSPRLHPVEASHASGKPGVTVTVTLRNSGGWDALDVRVERVLVAVLGADGRRAAALVVAGVEGAEGVAAPADGSVGIALRPLDPGALAVPRGGSLEVLRVKGSYTHVAHPDGQTERVDYVFEAADRERELGLEAVATWRTEWNESWGQKVWREMKATSKR